MMDNIDGGTEVERIKSMSRFEQGSSATERLRAMLGERGVRWEDISGFGVAATKWRSGDGSPCTALESDKRPLLGVPDGKLSVEANLTPEQAVEATLGRGTCEILGYDDGYDEGVDGEMYQYADARHFLSCGHEVYGSITPKYCPECGRKVVDEWASTSL